MSKPAKGRLRVAINAQLLPNGPSGGIVTVLRALAALTELNGPEEYVFIGPYEDPDWMRAILPPGQTIIRGPQFMSSDAVIDPLEPFKRKLGPLRPIVRGVKQIIDPVGSKIASSLSKGNTASRATSVCSSRSFFQSLGCDVIHFPFQAFEVTCTPSIYNPHDLQHLHLSQFFNPAEIARRENLYPVACRSAHTVVVATDSVKRDLVHHYRVKPDKIQVIPWAPPNLGAVPKKNSENQIVHLNSKYQLNGAPFILYPAMTWEHKNHVRLLEAVAYLRDRCALNLRVICTGFKTEFWPSIESKLNELSLNDVVKFPGLISADELGLLYRSSQFVFVPSLFEAASAPIFESWQRGTPVACSNIPAMLEQVADAALMFDPYSVESIAYGLARMTMDFDLREDLIGRGYRRLRDFSLERTARTYRAVYRRAGGRDLDDEDRHLLERDGQVFEKTEVQRECTGVLSP